MEDTACCEWEKLHKITQQCSNVWRTRRRSTVPTVLH